MRIGFWIKHSYEIFGSYQTKNKLYFDLWTFVVFKSSNWYVGVLFSVSSWLLLVSRRESRSHLFWSKTSRVKATTTRNKQTNKLNFLLSDCCLSCGISFFSTHFGMVFFPFRLLQLRCRVEIKLKSQQGYHAAIKTHFFIVAWEKKEEKLTAW